MTRSSSAIAIGGSPKYSPHASKSMLMTRAVLRLRVRLSITSNALKVRPFNRFNSTYENGNSTFPLVWGRRGQQARGRNPPGQSNSGDRNRRYRNVHSSPRCGRGTTNVVHAKNPPKTTIDDSAHTNHRLVKDSRQRIRFTPTA